MSLQLAHRKMIRHDDAFITVRVCQIRQAAVDDISSISFKFRLSFALLSQCFFNSGWTLSLTSCCLEKPERTEIKQVTEICFFHFYFVHNTGAIIIPCTKHNMHIGPQHTQQNFTPHFFIPSFVMVVSLIIPLKV